MKVRASDLSHHEISGLIGERDESNPGPFPIILEVGSNDGVDTLEFLHRFPDVRVYCFEPDPRAIEAWRQNVKDERAMLAEVACDVTNGRRLFHQSGGSPSPEYTDWTKSGSLLKPTGHLVYSPWCSFDRKLEVECVRLDDWMLNNAPDVNVIDLIWLDTQGAELRVLSGGPLALACSRYIYAECHSQGELYEGAPREPEMLAFMAERDFKCLGRYSDNLLFKNEEFA